MSARIVDPKTAGATKPKPQPSSPARRKASRRSAARSTITKISGWQTKDDAMVEKWYRRAAERGFAEAQNNLGLIYVLGRGVPQDDSTAVKWFRKAAEQGYAPAQNNLGEMRRQGRRVTK